MNRLIQLERSLDEQRERLLRRGARKAAPKVGRMASPMRAPTYQQRPKPFYATGEHVLAGEDLRELAGHEKVIKNLMVDLVLEVGKTDRQGKRVGFTYGELIAMGDLYDTFDEMDAAPAAELLRLREYIRRSRDHYRKTILKQGAGAKDPADSDWQDATNKRYLKLAFDNFAHFAPPDSALTGSGKGKDRRDHRRAWETCHQRALDLVRSKRTDQALHDALAINAFGDHFLTDAFAAGHLFNKADVAARFNSMIMDSSGKLNNLGKQFFQMVAAAAFKGPLKTAFSKHETVETYGVFNVAGWKVFPIHPNIDDAARFEKFLVGVHETEPDLIGLSIVAKVIHDKLNSWPGGLPVTNDVGDKWHLTGDGTLNPENLAIMRTAVARSIYNVAVEALAVANDNALLGYVWQYTPRPTAESKKLIKQLIDQFTLPMVLAAEAARFLGDHFQVILREAVDRGKMQPA
jgi:hypothetical protein